MEYKVEVNKRFRHVKIFRILKKPNENTNKFSKAMQSFVDKYIVRRQKIE